MKILSFSDVYLLNAPIEKLQSIIQEENIDIIILMGGLFPTNLSEDNSNKKIKLKKNIYQEKVETNILKLNWLLIPVLVIPDQNDLKNPKLLRQIQGQEAVWIRYIYNKGTVIDSWFIFSVTEDSENDQETLMKNIEEYSKVAPDRSILLFIGNKRFNFPEVYSIFLTGKAKIPNTSSFFVSIDSISENKVTIIDLEKKIINSILVQ